MNGISDSDTISHISYVDSYTKSQTFCTDSDTSVSSRRQRYIAEDDDSTIQMQRAYLPIYKIKRQLVKKLYKNDIVILKGDTACGKTTQVPQLILTEGLAGHLGIAVTQPHRVAATSIAKRVAKEMRTVVGQEVGYSVRFDDTTSESTKIKYVTDNILLRESISDPLLSSYSWVILDEAHERAIHTDVLFSVVKLARTKRSEQGFSPLKIVIMSATIDENKVISYFDNAPIVYIPGREHVINIYNANTVYDDYALFAVSTVWHLHNNEPEGDILVFLTGEDEVEWAIAYTYQVMEAESATNQKLCPCAFYASLPSKLQYCVFASAEPNTRKVIYATDIAETSLTIPGIKYVVDSGVVKVKLFNMACGLDLFKVQQISKAQAEQRMGRAGREREGHCYRLYSQEQYEEFAEFPVPEILRCNLASIVLQIISMGISDIGTFEFLDKPSDESIDAAIKQLILLGAVEEDSRGNVHLTRIGKQMIHFPLDPRFSRIIVSSGQFKCTDEILTIISLLSVKSIFLDNPSMPVKYLKYKYQFSHGEGDHIMLLNMYKAFCSAESHVGWCILHNVDYKSMTKALVVRKQLCNICRRIGIVPQSCGEDTSLVRKCLVTGLFMNSAYLYQKNSFKMIGSNEIAFIHRTSSLYRKKPVCCIYTDVVQTSKYYMKNISVVDDDWLLDTAPEYFTRCNF